mmetsp:Transcript_37769/g.87305  ORF Transcript_37769/g.87305 Transcript_37769/m.87305 type:complete len:477 (-) Transcript_37769:207-1637(-)
MLETPVASESQLHLAERLRLQAARRFAYDPELDTIEQELRSDLRSLGATGDLAWDITTGQPRSTSTTMDAKQAAAPPVIQKSQDDQVSAADERLNSFGEDDEEPVEHHPSKEGAMDVWEVTTQVAVHLEKHDHVTLTILENSARGLMKFHGFDGETGEVLERICSYEHFEALCNECNDPAGRRGAAVQQLFLKPQDEEDYERADPSSALLPAEMRGKRINKDALEGFGESDGEEEAEADFQKPVPVLLFEEGAGSALHNDHDRHDGWVVLTQDALVFDGKHHTVTVSEHPEKGLLMFEAFCLADENGEKRTRKCNHEDFEQLCESSSDTNSAARFRSAIGALLSAPQKEVREKAEGQADRRRRLSQALQTFGESESEVEPQQPVHLVDTEVDVAKGLEPGWHMISQQAFTMRGEHALLTILQNDDENKLQFTLLRNASGEVTTRDCGIQAFDVLCKRFEDLPEAACLSSAIAEVFK